MVILISGATHTGKTALAQKILERYGYPYLSLDHLKMGVIRSGYAVLSVDDDAAITAYLWPVVREMIKTAVENSQNLVVEGIYIPFDWARDFDVGYRRDIRFLCLIMTPGYIAGHREDILSHADDIERRLDGGDFGTEKLIAENLKNLEECRRNGDGYILIDGAYPTDIEAFFERPEFTFPGK